MANAERVLGFQHHFSPRVATKARYLLRHTRVFHVIFALIFCMVYFYATRRLKIASLLLTAGIILLVLAILRFSHGTN
jgi:cell division protein FtsW (lipid II flippase)